MELNKRHKKFADEYLINGFNATKAYLTVYQKVTQESAEALGCKLLGSVKVKNYIADNQKDMNKKYSLTKDKMIEELLEVIKSCKTDTKIKDKGNWNKAIDILNKLGGFYINNIDITTNGQPIQINLNLNDNE